MGLVIVQQGLLELLGVGHEWIAGAGMLVKYRNIDGTPGEFTVGLTNGERIRYRTGNQTKNGREH